MPLKIQTNRSCPSLFYDSLSVVQMPLVYKVKTMSSILFECSPCTLLFFFSVFSKVITLNVMLVYRMNTSVSVR